jgi:hypothetical protein
MTMKHLSFLHYSILLLPVIFLFVLIYQSPDYSDANGTAFSLNSEMIPLQLPADNQQCAPSDDTNKTIQLRWFIIDRDKMDEFLDAWLKGVYPLRIKSGFKIEGAWVVKEKNEFIWILSYNGPESFEVKDSTYYASEARKILDPDPAQYVAKSEKFFLKQIKP